MSILFLKHYVRFLRDGTGREVMETMIQNEGMASVFQKSYSVMEGQTSTHYQMRVTEIGDHRI